MKQRLAIITEIIAPYRIPLFNALAEIPEIDLHVIFLGETDPNLREWRVYREEIRFSFEVLPSWRRRIGKYNALLNARMGAALTHARPVAILCGGYSYVSSWQALLWARKHRVAFLLWSESNRQDQRRYLPAVEWLKKQFLHRCDGFVVPGQSAFKYVNAQKIRNQPIFVAPNAVDNRLFSNAAEFARNNADRLRQELNLPQHYFLFVGRLVREKGVYELLSAYTSLNPDLRRQFGLVFVGDGPCRRQLQELAHNFSGRAAGIVFGGFVQREQLGAYYGLAEVLVLPTHTDTWGMAVNEAMACGLPLIVSEAAGCASDLVQEDGNGVLVKPRDVSGLASAMSRMGCDAHVRRRLGQNSARRILDYSPDAWAKSVARAIQEATRHS